MIDKSNVIVTALGGLMLLLALVSRRLRDGPLPATLLALGAGILLGPAALGVIDLAQLGDQPKILEDVARLGLGIGLVGVALRLPRDYLRRNWREIGLLLALGMPAMWAISTLLVYLLSDNGFWLAALLGGLFSPTDPVASAAVVTGPAAEQNIPRRLRRVASLESGLNDGLGYPFVLLSYLMLVDAPAHALSEWLLDVVLRQVLLGAAAGALAGYATGRLYCAASARGLISPDWRATCPVALALFAVGGGKLIHCDEVLVVFSAGLAFVQAVGDHESESLAPVHGAFDRFFTAAAFALLGLALPWDGWQALGWHGVALGLGVLLLRRVPVMLLLRPLLPSVRSTRDALFAGWFGPIAVAAIYYAGMMQHRLHEPRIWDIASLVICMSALLHGVSAVPFTRWYGRRNASPAQGKE